MQGRFKAGGDGAVMLRAYSLECRGASRQMGMGPLCRELVHKTAGELNDRWGWGPYLVRLGACSDDFVELRTNDLPADKCVSDPNWCSMCCTTTYDLEGLYDS